MKTLYNSKYQEISFDSESGILYEIWKAETKKMNNDTFKLEMLKQIEAAKKTNPKAVISDTFQMNFIITIEMQEWMNKVIFPEFIKLRINKLAILLSRKLITQLSIEQTMEEEEGAKFSVQYFSSELDAKKWLKAVK